MTLGPTPASLGIYSLATKMLPLALFFASIALASRLIVNRVTGNYLIKPRGMPRSLPDRTRWQIIQNLNESRTTFDAELLLQSLQLLPTGSIQREDILGLVSEVMMQAEDAGEAWLVREVHHFAEKHGLFTFDPDRVIPSNGQDLLEPEKK